VRLYDKREFSCQFWNHSEGEESAQGRWAKGPTMDGRGEFEYVANPQPLGPQPEPPQPNPQLHGTAKTPHASQNSATGDPNVVDRVVEVIDRITPGGQQQLNRYEELNVPLEAAPGED